MTTLNIIICGNWSLALFTLRVHTYIGLGGAELYTVYPVIKVKIRGRRINSGLDGPCLWLFAFS